MGSQETSLELLSVDLIINILVKLSEKDLIRCKCVSKEWHRIITHVCVPRLSVEAPVSGVYFRIAQLPGSLGHLTTYSPQKVKKLLFDHIKSDDSVHIMDGAPLKDEKSGFEGMSYASILPFDHRGPDFLDCCNGLLLFVHRPKPRFYVCNPAIKQCVPIPLPPPTLHLPSLYASLAFDPSESIHYRIVILSLTTQPQYLLIFCSQTGEWMTHEVQVRLPVPYECFRMVRHCVYFKGMLYRLSLPDKILCIDLESKTIHIIASPDERNISLPRGCFGVLAGSLSYAKREYGHLWVWLLDNHSKQGEWILKYKIAFSHIYELALSLYFATFTIWIHTFAFHPKSNIIFLGSARSLMMYDLSSGHMELVQSNAISDIHCGSLFSLFTYRHTLITLKSWCRTPNDLDVSID
uniref:F-box domain-containing protein n=1 Tax=Chenopodium quinoa TaxID=63459 RepID=A0A803LRY4_CHEQI